MNTQHESANLNGAASLYLMIGELREGQKHLATGLQDVSEKVDRLERNARRKKEPPALLSSLGMTGKEMLILVWLACMGVTGTLTPETFRALLLGH
jgi:hypothetical protein